MKARYAVIDEEERNWFEKEFQLPFGYSNCFVSLDLEEAIERMRIYKKNSSNVRWVVEKIDEDGKEIVYRS